MLLFLPPPLTSAPPPLQIESEPTRMQSRGRRLSRSHWTCKGQLPARRRTLRSLAHRRKHVSRGTLKPAPGGRQIGRGGRRTPSAGVRRRSPWRHNHRASPADANHRRWSSFFSAGHRARGGKVDLHLPRRRHKVVCRLLS